MSDAFYNMANLIETYGQFWIRMIPPRKKNGAYPAISLILQLDDMALATAVAASFRKKVYSFKAGWSVYFEGAQLGLWLAMCREYFCPAHRRLVSDIIHLGELNKKRKLLGRAGASHRGKARARFGKINTRLFQSRQGYFDETMRDYDKLQTECPVWGMTGIPARVVWDGKKTERVKMVVQSSHGKEQATASPRYPENV